MIPYDEAEIVIVGLVRNGSTVVESEIATLGKAFSWAKKLRFLLIESDSSDQTVDTLERLSQQHDTFEYVALGNLRDHYPKRTDRIAYCRNHYLKLINELPEYRGIDFVVVADMDGVNSLVSADAVKTCWERTDWDVCTANQRGPYYDIWALRHPIWSPNDCIVQFEFLHSNGLGPYRSAQAAIHGRMITLKPSSDWIEVDSSYGGLAIYRREVLKSVHYVGLAANGKEVCEHVSLHEQIRAAGGRIFINPALINAGVVEYSRDATTVGMIRLWIRHQLRTTAQTMGITPFLKKIRAYIKN